MSDNFRALIAILILAMTVFAFARRTACTIIDGSDFTRRRNLWLTLTLAAFLSPNFWVYTIIALPLLIYVRKRDHNPPALFFFILFALPTASIAIPAMGVINFIFDLSHARLLELFILLPAFFALIRQSDTISFGRTDTDKALTAYLLLTTLIYLRETTVTDILRQTFYLFIDVFLPYFVISRSLKTLQAFRGAILSLVLAIMILALIGAFEIYKHWMLYRELPGALGLVGMRAKGAYLVRDGMVRATASAGSAITLGYLMAVGIGFYLFMQRSIEKKYIRRLGMVILAAGLFSALSRGPWVGAAVLLLVFVTTGRHPARRLMVLGLASVLSLFFISTLPGGERVINLLPYIGTTEKETIDAREELFTISMSVIKRNPWFGTDNYREDPEMQKLIEAGGGFVDIVNTYVNIALGKGLTGLGLFVGFFVLTLFGTYRAMRTIPDKDSEEHLLGRSLLSTLMAIMVIIATMSSITFIPIVYWSVAGMGVAYAQMVRKNAEIEGSQKKP